MPHAPAVTEPAGPAPLRAKRGSRLVGEATVPGDKSISHRALMIGALAVGETRIEGLLEGEDVLNTGRALEKLGVEVGRTGPGAWRVHGVGIGGLTEPSDVLDFGNAGTGARLMMGVLAGHAFTSIMTGDASLRRRPMNRVIEPLREVGARFVTREGGRLPLAMVGAANPIPIRYRLPVASAQVKSAVLFAGLSAPGETIVIEPEPSRDHTELMLRHFGARVEVRAGEGKGEHAIVLGGQPELEARHIRVPGDISSAAFPLAAALLVPGSEVTLRNVGINPLRTGLLDTLGEMGATISMETSGRTGAEPVADLRVRASALKGVHVPAERAPRMIDEYPILAALAACAEGTSRFDGLAELRVKESDRLAAIANGLKACGVAVEELKDGLIIEGRGRPPAGGGMIEAKLDHRIAMAFLVLGLVTVQPVVVDDGSPIATSFPDFVLLMTRLGASIEPA
ncbi:MAG: 3-phosphoshikimate 1-carboxyvinyltransferase [Alphaproteobacteria bacterium]|nr:3-phosphoshikimate 1-carboxyvinyltransferase [Alphaproteobacteria bacterium]